MSTTLLLKGAIAILKQPVCDISELNEQFYDQSCILRYNYDGTLIYADFNRSKPWREREDIYGLHFNDCDIDKFVALLEANDIEYIEGSIRPFIEIYHNSSDSSVDLLTVSEYKTLFNV